MSRKDFDLAPSSIDQYAKVGYYANGGGVRGVNNPFGNNNKKYGNFFYEVGKIGERFNFHKDFGWKQYGENFSTKREAEIVAEQVKEKFKGDDGRNMADVVVVELYHQPDKTKYAITEYKVLYREENFGVLGDFYKRVYGNGGGVGFKIGDNVSTTKFDNGKVVNVYTFNKDEIINGKNLKKGETLYEVKNLELGNSDSYVFFENDLEKKFGGNEISKEKLESMVGRKLNRWNDDKVVYMGTTYEKCYLRPYYIKK